MTFREAGSVEATGKKEEEEGGEEQQGTGSPPCVEGGGDSSLLQTGKAAADAAAKGMKGKVALKSGVGGSPARRQWWGDCQPHVVLLREALLSSAPDIAVLGPLHGCFSFYMTHLHNEVLSSTYARSMTFGANVTRLESAFMWLGGWRPTSALVLVYSLMGIEIEDALQAARLGMNIVKKSTTSLLSTRQLSVMHTLQKHTQHMEMKISKKLTVLQMLIGDQDMLEAVLLDAASALENDSSRFAKAVEKRMCRFRRLIVQAEELRLHTLKDLLSLLTPIQAARCCVSVFEICFSLHTVGLRLSGLSPALPIPVASPALSAVADTPTTPRLPIPVALPALSAPPVTSMLQIPVTLPALPAIVDTSSTTSDALLCDTPPYKLASRNEENPGSTGVDHRSEEEVIANRLLILSPSTSDVTIQNCRLESFTLEPRFGVQVHLGSANGSCDAGEICTGEEAALFEWHKSDGDDFNRLTAESECAKEVSQHDLGKGQYNVKQRS